MAQKVTLVDDIDGTPLDSDGGTIRFGIDGANYEIDLSAKNTQKLHDALEDFVTNARRVRGNGGTATSSTAKKGDPQRLKAIREWANANGHTVSSRGRIPTEIQDAYDAAN
ncbi:Lsr2 family protein [Rathayibacter sp. SD072]|uniref:histone-like nucleoid-structuring protein Lsr2 n=1 Tax=Rathayibacter sp. SD072 TaxID=2781731 RepID=UPI001A979BEB|nr:Lsr2 family protein [Rathayibacter sp. SD072]MBO0985022.1 Lsr2 family protein [Rathayibacter sp. SD072]